MIYNAPGTYLQEVDESNYIPNLSTTSAAIVGYAPKGDIDSIRLITNTKQFIREYGVPVVGDDFGYSALAYLANGRTLYALRVVNGSLYGGIAVSDSDNDNVQFIAGRNTKAFSTETEYPNAIFYISAKDPGTWNNNIGIRIVNVDNVASEFTIEVYEKQTGGVYVKVESFVVSRKNQKDGYGRQQYLETRINGLSQYIYVSDNTDVSNSVMPKAQATTLALMGGTDGSNVTDSDVIKGWDRFSNPNDFRVSLLINAGYTNTPVQSKMKEVADLRKYCMAILDVPYEQCSSIVSMITWRNVTQNFNSNKTALYGPWVKVYDPYNDMMVSVPLSGFIAGQYAYNDYVSRPWYAPAGFSRGVLNVQAIDFGGLESKISFTESEIGELYDAQINVVQSFSGDGFVIWGQKTQQTKASAYDRVNVRRLMNLLEEAVEGQAKYFLFEPNNARTRFRFWAMTTEYMDTLAAGGAFQDELGDRGYAVICDTTNNTPATIDMNELHLDIYVKPVRAAEYIIIRSTVTTTGASFAELVSRNTVSL